MLHSLPPSAARDDSPRLSACNVGSRRQSAVSPVAREGREWNGNSRRMNTARKSSTAESAPPASTKGVKIARANRLKCNTLSNDERAALTSRALNLIYGSNGPEVPARRR